MDAGGDSDDCCSDTALVPSGRDRLSPPSLHPLQLQICGKTERHERVADRFEKAKGEMNVFEAASGDTDEWTCGKN